jgi:signal peptidase I
MLVVAVFFYMNFKTIEVSGISMMPTLKDHQHVLVSKAYWLIGRIRDKDVVVLKDPHGPGDIIKRVCYSAGESVRWDLRPDTAPGIEKDYKVPDGCVYVLGDNRPFSEDSRKFGFVDMSNIIGKVVVLNRK